MQLVNTSGYKKVLAVLASAAFVVGTAELVVVGILSLIAQDLHVSVSNAGLLVTSYALGIALLAPVITAITIKAARRNVLLVAMVVYILGNVGALLFGSFEMFVAMRVLTGALHGLIIGTGFSIAAAAAPKGKQGQAIGIVFGGLSIATVLGVPFGSLLGQMAGWETAFIAVIVLAVMSTISAYIVVPNSPGNALGAAFKTQAKSILTRPVILTLLVGLVILCGQFTVFTYLESLLRAVTHISAALVSVFLLLYGAACAAGTFAGGKLADHNAARTLIAANIILIGLFLLLSVVAASPILVAILLILWGFVGFGLIPSYQLQVLSLAKEGASLASTLGVSAVNGGVAIGAVIGGLVLRIYNPAAIAVAGALICLLALPLTLYTKRFWRQQALTPSKQE